MGMSRSRSVFGLLLAAVPCIVVAQWNSDFKLVKRVVSDEHGEGAEQGGEKALRDWCMHVVPSWGTERRQCSTAL